MATLPFRACPVANADRPKRLASGAVPTVMAEPADHANVQRRLVRWPRPDQQTRFAPSRPNVNGSATRRRCTALRQVTFHSTATHHLQHAPER
jgi:hypothetical protein